MAGPVAEMGCLGVVLAAGASRRFGSDDKLLAEFRGAPLVARAATALAGAGCDGLAAVVSNLAVADALPADFEPIFIAAGQEMAASFHRAIDLAADRGAAKLLICLGDMPGISVNTLRMLRQGTASNGCLMGDAAMPPMLLMARDFQAARDAAEGDRGARRFLARLPKDALIRISPREAHDIDRLSDLDADL